MVFVFEGIDGSGKTTISQMLARELSKVLVGRVLWFSEPSHTILGRSLKRILTSSDLSLSIFEQSLLFTADRLYLLRNYVIPRSIEGKIILMDRSFVSTYAYQIMNLEEEKTKEILITLTEFSIGGFYVDVLFYLDCPSKISLRRIKEKDNIESKGYEFIERVRQNYLCFLRNPHPCIRKVVSVDASRGVDSVYQEVRREVLEYTGYLA